MSAVGLLTLLALLGLWITGVVICFQKGKPWMAVIGIFLCGPVAVIGAIRLAKPTSSWARTRYAHDPIKMQMSRLRFPKQAMWQSYVDANVAALPTGAAYREAE